MIDWTTLDLLRTWPLWLLAAATAALAGAWVFGRAAVFPNLHLLGAGPGRWAQRAPLRSGGALLALITLLLLEPSVVLEQRVTKNARDFVLLVDTSRSMRHDTDVRREDVEINFERRADAFLESVADPSRLPMVSRFELARESLYRFLADRRADDRVALLYFNDNVHPVSGLSNDVAFVTEQLGEMDDFVNWGTDIEEAMTVSLDLLERYPGNNRRSLILITDAETRYTEDLTLQFERLRDSNLAFYLLWITADVGQLYSDDATAFLELARTVGKVFTIQNPDANNLQQALRAISSTEAYDYEETNRRTLSLARPLRLAVLIAFLVWLGLAMTSWCPLGRRWYTGEPGS